MTPRATPSTPSTVTFSSTLRAVALPDRRMSSSATFDCWRSCVQMPWHFSLMGANCSVRSSARLSFSQPSAAFRGLMAPEPARAARAMGSHPAMARAMGRHASSRRWTSAAAWAFSEATATRSGSAATAIAFAAPSRSGTATAFCHASSRTSTSTPSSPTSDAWRTVSARGIGNERAPRRATSADRCACVASRAVSRNRLTSALRCSRHEPSSAAFLPHTGHGPSPCLSWNRKA